MIDIMIGIFNLNLQVLDELSHSWRLLGGGGHVSRCWWLPNLPLGPGADAVLFLAVFLLASAFVGPIAAVGSAMGSVASAVGFVVSHCCEHIF